MGRPAADGCRRDAWPSGSPPPRAARCRTRSSAQALSARSCAGARSGSSEGAPTSFSASREVHDRNLLGHHRQRHAEQRDGVRACSSHGVHHAASALRRIGQHVPVVADETQLGVERDVLRDVPYGVVRLRPEDRPHLEDTLEDAHQHLLVQLWRLGQVRWSTEVVDREHVGAGLGARAHQLRRLDLGESRVAESAAEPPHARSCDPPDGLAAGVPKCDRRVVEQRGQTSAQRGSPELDRRRLGWVAEHLERRLDQLQAARRGRVRGRPCR